jgi:chromosome segregation ATPase
VAAVLLFRRMGVQIRRRLSHHTCRRQQKVEGCVRLPDLLARLHSLIACQGELETEFESRDRESSDVHSVANDNQSRLATLKTQMREARQENSRFRELRVAIDREYQHQIASLRMALSREIDTRKERIDVAKQKLKLQRRAKKLTSETISESQEALQTKLTALQKRLVAAQVVAVQFRDELLATEEHQEQTITEIAVMKGQIAGLKKECTAITQAAGEGQEAVAGTIEDLNVQYQEVLEELAQARKCIERYDEELLDQDGQMDMLTKKLALSRQRYKTALTACRDEDDGDDDL